MITVTSELVRNVHAKMKESRLPLENLTDVEDDIGVNESEDAYLLEHQKELAYLEGERNSELEDAFSSFID